MEGLLGLFRVIGFIVFIIAGQLGAILLPSYLLGMMFGKIGFAIGYPLPWILFYCYKKYKWKEKVSKYISIVVLAIGNIFTFYILFFEILK